MKKFGIFALTVILLISLVACGRRKETKPTATTSNTRSTVPDVTILDPTIMDPTLDTNIPDPEVDSTMPDLMDPTSATENTR